MNAGAEQSERTCLFLDETDRQTLVLSITWSRNVRHIKTLTQVVDEFLRKAFNESLNEMECMSIEVGCRKSSR